MKTVLENIAILWEYLIINDKLAKSDIIIGFGSNDITVAKRASNLYFEKVAPLILFTGGLGKGTKDNWNITEADTFCEIAKELGVPSDKIIVENKSTNTGENIRFTRELINLHSINVQLATIVHQPNMGRRIYAALKKQWPEIDIQITASNYSLSQYIYELKSTGIDECEIFSNIVGDFQRIDAFAKKGYQIDQYIPDRVWDAFKELCDLGYTKYLILD